MTVTSSNGGPVPRHTRIGILGAGFGGLGLAIRLKQAGINDFVVWERDPEVGGTWWANTYPGCQCDIPSHLYSFSFAPNPEWTRTYPLQPEIQEYLRECTDRFGCATTSGSAASDQRANGTRPRACGVSRPAQGPFTADLLFAAPGFLSAPATPALPGLETLRGHHLPHGALEPRSRPHAAAGSR